MKTKRNKKQLAIVKKQGLASLEKGKSPKK